MGDTYTTTEEHVLIAYWIVAGLLAAFNLFAGGNKLVRSQAQLEPMMAWAPTFPAWAVKGIGLAEVLGALGLVLPPLTGIAPVLALVAALGLALLQLIAAVFHV